MSLIARLQAGEKEAQLELQQYILDRELGGCKCRRRGGGGATLEEGTDWSY